MFVFYLPKHILLNFPPVSSLAPLPFHFLAWNNNDLLSRLKGGTGPKEEKVFDKCHIRGKKIESAASLRQPLKKAASESAASI